MFQRENASVNLHICDSAVPLLGLEATWEKDGQASIFCASQTPSDHFPGIPVSISPLPGAVSPSAGLLGPPNTTTQSKLFPILIP